MRTSVALSLLALVSTATAASTALAARALDLGVPLSWRKFSDNRSKAEHIAISQNGANQITGQLNTNTATFNGIGYWQSGNVIASLANHDHFAGSTTYRTIVLNTLNRAYQIYAHGDQFQYNDDALWWGTAGYYAFRAYGDQNALNHAIDTWNHVSQYVVNSAGKVSGKSFTPAASCNGKTMAGGAFWRPTADDTSINSVTTGLYLTLSAFLATTSSDAKYRNAAIASANWIRNQNLNSAGIPLDTVNGRDCSRPNDWIFTYNSGKFIEGMAVLADVTRDQQWYDLLAFTVNAAVKNRAWQGEDGIITEGASPNSNNDGVGFKSVFIRALNEAFVRTTNRDLDILIHSYIDVQYNALLDLAANGNTYSSAWHGPPQGFTTWGQMAALDVLVSAISANT